MDKEQRELTALEKSNALLKLSRIGTGLAAKQPVRHVREVALSQTERLAKRLRELHAKEVMGVELTGLEKSMQQIYEGKYLRLEGRNWTPSPKGPK